MLKNHRMPTAAATAPTSDYDKHHVTSSMNSQGFRPYMTNSTSIGTEIRMAAGSGPQAEPLPKSLDKIKRAEACLESLRYALAVNRAFEPLSAFQRMDRNDDRCLTPHEILRFLRENSVHSVDEADCANMVGYYRKTDTGGAFLGFKEFLDIVLPQEDEVLRFAVSQRPRTYEPTSGGYLEPVVEQQLAGLLEREIIFKKEWSALGMQDLVSYMRQEKTKARRENPAQFFDKPLSVTNGTPAYQETFRTANPEPGVFKDEGPPP